LLRSNYKKHARHDSTHRRLAIQQGDVVRGLARTITMISFQPREDVLEILKRIVPHYYPDCPSMKLADSVLASFVGSDAYYFFDWGNEDFSIPNLSGLRRL
jgi:hypothetical protein